MGQSVTHYILEQIQVTGQIHKFSFPFTNIARCGCGFSVILSHVCLCVCNRIMELQYKDPGFPSRHRQIIAFNAKY